MFETSGAFSYWTAHEEGQWSRVDKDFDAELTKLFGEYKVMAHEDASVSTMMSSQGPVYFGNQNFYAKDPIYLPMGGADFQKLELKLMVCTRLHFKIFYQNLYEKKYFLDTSSQDLLWRS